MENEIMNYDETGIEEVVTDDEVGMEDSAMSTGVAMLLGAGLTVATAAIVKLGKKLIATYKAKKESKKAESDEDYEEVDE